jgi:elongation factor 1 alpha-like protein
MTSSSERRAKDHWRLHDTTNDHGADGCIGTQTPKKDISPPNGLTQGLAVLSVQEQPKVKSKNLNVLEEFGRAKMKDAASFVVVGHVDHGKSTLMGRLLYDLKVVDEKTLEKLRRDSKKIGKASFALAWVMDMTSDERERGITVDIATNHFETDKTRFTILDAPGHQDFVPNMIAGASQADFAVLVIDASTNNFESGLRGQTKEHAMLVRSMGVQRLIVAINKMDTTNWSEERFNQIQREMTAFLTSANFSTKNVSFVPCAGLTGENIVTPVGSSKAPWYKGPTLVQELDRAEPTKRAIQRPLRLTISEVFSSSPNNPVSVSGKIESGALQVGDKIRVLPSNETATVKTIEADGKPCDWAVAGQIAVLNLADIDRVHLKHGDLLVPSSDTTIQNRKEFTAKILAFDHIMPSYVDVHKGPMHVTGKIKTLVATLEKASGEVEKKKPKVVQPGGVARVVLELEGEAGMPIEAGARVVLRSEGKSVAAGLVE